MQEQLADYGLYAEFSSVRLSMSQGLVAEDLVLFEDKDHTQRLMGADRIMVDIDRSRVLRGDWEVRSVSFENLFLRLPEVCEPHHLRDLNGTATLDRENVLTIPDATGRLGELDLSLDAVFTNFKVPEPSPEEEKKENPLEDFIADLQTEIANWTVSKTSSPSLAIHLRGNLEQPASLEGKFNFFAPDITRYTYEMSDLAVNGVIHMNAMRIENASFSDKDGELVISGYYDFMTKIAEFDAISGIALNRLLKNGLQNDSLDLITFNAAPQIETKGLVRFYSEAKPEVELSGKVLLKDFRYLGFPWVELQSDFSLQRGDLYLRDLALTHAEGMMNGQLLFQDELVRYRAISTLPSYLYQPFIKKDTPVEKSIALAGFDEKSEYNVNLVGTIRPSDLTDWTAIGTVELKNFTYNEVPIIYGSARFNLTQLQSIYTNPEIEIDLTNTKPFKEFGGPESAIVRADTVKFDRVDHSVDVEHFYGVCWPSAALALFIPETAEYIEDTFRASEPPAFSSSGYVDLHPDAARTSFFTRITAEAPMYYEFLGKDITLRNTSAFIHSRPKQVDITEFSSYAFSGPIEGSVSILTPNEKGRKPDFRGSVLWTRLRLSDIGDTYDFEKIEKGLVTGRFDFTGTEERIQALNGTGNVGLEQGELFKAPIFGPLSPFIANIQGDERNSHEVARDASASFLIRDGILYTDDFITSTDSLTVHGEGSIDIARKTLDMTARADTQGLLKLVTLPLAPFNGLFQFHGTGPVTDPKWENTPFTRQVREKKAPLFAPPPKAVVVPE